MAKRTYEDTILEVSRKLFYRIFREINSKLSKSLKCDDCPASFTAVDRLTVMYCIMGYSMDEINPYLEDYLYDCIETGLEQMSPSDYSVIEEMSTSSDEGASLEDVKTEIYKELMQKLDERTFLKKIQKFTEKI